MISPAVSGLALAWLLASAQASLNFWTQINGER